MNAREREVMDALAEALRSLQWSANSSSGDESLAAYDALVAQDSSEGSGEAVATVSESWMYDDTTAEHRIATRGGVLLPEGTKLYLNPQPAQRISVDALAQFILEVDGNSSDRSARALAERIVEWFAQGAQKQRNAGDDARDAARYRWLRSQGFGFAHDAAHCGISTGRWGDWPFDTDEGFAAHADSIIDAAIAAQQRQGERT